MKDTGFAVFGHDIFVGHFVPGALLVSVSSLFLFDGNQVKLQELISAFNLTVVFVFITLAFVSGYLVDMLGHFFFDGSLKVWALEYMKSEKFVKDLLIDSVKRLPGIELVDVDFKKDQELLDCVLYVCPYAIFRSEAPSYISVLHDRRYYNYVSFRNLFIVLLISAVPLILLTYSKSHSYMYTALAFIGLFALVLISYINQKRFAIAPAQLVIQFVMGKYLFTSSTPKTVDPAHDLD